MKHMTILVIMIGALLVLVGLITLISFGNRAYRPTADSGGRGYTSRPRRPRP